MRALLAASVLLGVAGTAAAEDARPKGHPASEQSVPTAAPPATTTNTTGAHDQGNTIAKMNAAERKKVEQTGK